MSLHLPRSLLNMITQVSQEGNGSSSNDSQRLEFDGHWLHSLMINTAEHVLDFSLKQGHKINYRIASRKIWRAFILANHSPKFGETNICTLCNNATLKILARF